MVTRTDEELGTGGRNGARMDMKVRFRLGRLPEACQASRSILEHSWQVDLDQEIEPRACSV
jgi:hypothetical protein